MIAEKMAHVLMSHFHQREADNRTRDKWTVNLTAIKFAGLTFFRHCLKPYLTYIIVCLVSILVLQKLFRNTEMTTSLQEN